jgi:hypothetical protein
MQNEKLYIIHWDTEAQPAFLFHPLIPLQKYFRYAVAAVIRFSLTGHNGQIQWLALATRDLCRYWDIPFLNHYVAQFS